MTIPIDVIISGWKKHPYPPIYDGRYAYIDRVIPTIYVDNTLGADITNGTYSITNRDGSGSDGDAYATIQSAINNSVVGEQILMRGGLYTEIDIDIPESKNGTAWAYGKFTTLKSFPNEWAKVDATGLNAGSNNWLTENVFRHPVGGYGAGSNTEYTEYWEFRNFEVTGGRNGFFLKLRHIKFRFMWIHNNGREFVDGIYDTLVAGILSVCPQYADIQFCRIEDNYQTNVSDLNNSNILFDSDYKDSDGNGEAFDPLASTHHNTIAYNYLSGSRISLRQKNQQRFGFNDRDPNDMTYAGYGDKWHHNIILHPNTIVTEYGESVGASQDFIQVYKNICEATINIGRLAGGASDVPILYNECVYNNAVKHLTNSYPTYGSYTTSGGYDVLMANYYDTGLPLPNANKTIHEHRWFYNNIDSNLQATSEHEESFQFHVNTPQNVSEPAQDNSDLIVENNFSHDNPYADVIKLGNNIDAGYADCVQAYKTMDEMNSCMEAWRGLGADTVANWENSTVGLYSGTGAASYIPATSFVVFGAITIGNGGRNITHPYLTGVTIPSHLGPVNPTDTLWVSGVYDNVSSQAWLQSQTDDPTWTEDE